MDGTSAREQLAASALLAGLAPEHLDFIAAHAAARKVRKGEVLFRHGDEAAHFYMILSGEVAVEVAAIEGPALEMQSLGPGSVLGWSWLIAPYRWAFQARARADSEVLEFDGAAILERCEQDSRFGYELLKRFSALMSERLEFARRKMMDEWKPAGFA